MQKKYGPDGLKILTVHLDTPDEKTPPAKVAAMLKSKQADSFPCVELPLEQEEWQKKFHFNTYPCVFVFDRKGEWTQFNPEDKKYEKDKDIIPMLEDIDRLVGTLLKKK